VDKTHFNIPIDQPRVDEDKHNEIIEAITLFIKEGKIKDN